MFRSEGQLLLLLFITVTIVTIVVVGEGGGEGGEEGGGGIVSNVLCLCGRCCRCCCVSVFIIIVNIIVVVIVGAREGCWVIQFDLVVQKDTRCPVIVVVAHSFCVVICFWLGSLVEQLFCCGGVFKMFSEKYSAFNRCFFWSSLFTVFGRAEHKIHELFVLGC